MNKYIINAMREKTTWITWETQRRNWELADAFSARYCQFDHSKRGPILRYILSIKDTLALLLKIRPPLVFAQNPSLVLCSLLAVCKSIFSYRLVVDLHNVAIEQCSSPHLLVRHLARYICRNADLLIVSNSSLAPSVTPYNSRVGILPDRLPTMPKSSAPAIAVGHSRPHATLISSFANDEPIEIFLNAILDVDTPFTLFVTGSKKKAQALLHLASDKIIFTDYLTHDEFAGLVSSSDFVIDLTTRQDCLVCGAYEALAAEVPCILSHTTVIEELFGSWAFLTDNDTESFNRVFQLALIQSTQRRERLAQEKVNFLNAWNASFNKVLRQLELLERSRR